MLIQTRELEELQARIRATEARLKARQSVILDGTGSSSSAGAAKEDLGYRSAGEKRCTSYLIEDGSQLTQNALMGRFIHNIPDGHDGAVLEQR